MSYQSLMKRAELSLFRQLKQPATLHGTNTALEVQYKTRGEITLKLPLLASVGIGTALYLTMQGTTFMITGTGLKGDGHAVIAYPVKEVNAVATVERSTDSLDLFGRSTNEWHTVCSNIPLIVATQESFYCAPGTLISQGDVLLVNGNRYRVSGVATHILTQVAVVKQVANS